MAESRVRVDSFNNYYLKDSVQLEGIIRVHGMGMPEDGSKTDAHTVEVQRDREIELA